MSGIVYFFCCIALFFFFFRLFSSVEDCVPIFFIAFVFSNIVGYCSGAEETSFKPEGSLFLPKILSDVRPTSVDGMSLPDPRKDGVPRTFRQGFPYKVAPASVISTEPLGVHDIFVQYNDQGKIFEVHWDVYCKVYNYKYSVLEVMERSLVVRELHLSRPLDHIMSVLLKEDIVRHARVSYKAPTSEGCGSLEPAHIAKMFGKGMRRVWKFLNPEDGFGNNDVRIAFSHGTLYSTIVPEGDICYREGDGLFDLQPVYPNFVERVLVYAQSQHEILKRDFLQMKDTLVVRCVTKSKEVHSVVWPVCDLTDCDGMPLKTFFQDIFLQGVGFGFSGEQFYRDFAFCNNGIKQRFEDFLVLDLRQKMRVKRFEEDPFITKKDIEDMGDMAWTVVRERVRPFAPESWSFSIGRWVCEGLPQHPKQRIIISQCGVNNLRGVLAVG